MLNDFPDSAWTSEEEAHSYCRDLNSREDQDLAKLLSEGILRPRKYYRWHKIELRKEQPREQRRRPISQEKPS